ncbi:hypothetical protein [uncultured Paraglaciecola sp.]|uniref:hypothetical protein n=1 Tax=uncultured Paraglaciecola sp. TaxID=1765024 RepID=UPI0030D9E1F7
MIRHIVLVLGLCILCNSSAYSQVENSFQLVKAKAINRNLALQFPVDRSFQGIQATFSDPQILIDTLDQTIKLQMTVSANSAEQHFSAKLVFTGDMKFDLFLESYLFEDLVLDSFKIEQDSYVDSQPTVKIIKQSLINNFEDIELFNLTELNSFSPKRAADEIEISMGQLRFIWH